MSKNRRKRKPAEVICPYCDSPAELKNRFVLKLSGNGKVWICSPCQARVGVHKGSKEYEPLGRLANEELRNAKIQAHAYFDPLWRYKIKKDNVSKSKARRAAYSWLSYQMSIPELSCHIGMFDVEQCNTVVELCKPYTSRALAKLRT